MKKLEIQFYNENDQLVVEQAFGVSFCMISVTEYLVILYDEDHIETLSIHISKVLKIESL